MLSNSGNIALLFVGSTFEYRLGGKMKPNKLLNIAEAPNQPND